MATTERGTLLQMDQVAVARAAAQEPDARLSPRVAAAAAIASGVLYFLAFPGIDWWPLGLVALVPLRLALVGQTPKHAFRLSWLTGLTLISLGFYWMVGMLKTFSGFPTFVCLCFVFIANAFQACRMGLFGWLFVRAEGRGWPPGLVWVLALPAVELVFPVLFWWSFGAVLHPASALTQVADVGGILGVCAVAAAANWAVSEWVLTVRRGLRVPFVATLPYWLAPVAACVYGAVRIPRMDAATAAAPHSEIGLVQANLSLLGKRHDPLDNLRRHLLGMASLFQKAKPELVLWSETVVTHAVEVPGAGELGRHAMIVNVGVPLLFGAVIRQEVPGARYHISYNSALIADAQGVVQGRYDKQELVAFSEKMPFGHDFPWLYELSPNSGHFESSDRIGALPFGDHRIAATICNDDVSTSATRRALSDPNTDLIVNLTNDAWFGDTTEPRIHLALAKFRAIEHRRFFVRATNSGVSAFVDPVGRVVAKTETFQATTLSHPVAWLRGRTVYEIIGDSPYWLGVVFVAFAAFCPLQFLNKRARDV